MPIKHPQIIPNPTRNNVSPTFTFVIQNDNSILRIIAMTNVDSIEPSLPNTKFSINKYPTK